MADRLTHPQQKVLAALKMMYEQAPAAFHSRIDIGRRANGIWRTYPMKTLWTLYKHGYVEPLSRDIAHAVRTRVCRCGSDRWRITHAGHERTRSMRIQVAAKETA